jgi:hypothetical protein
MPYGFEPLEPWNVMFASLVTDHLGDLLEFAKGIECELWYFENPIKNQ